METERGVTGRRHPAVRAERRELKEKTKHRERTDSVVRNREQLKKNEER